jgi:TM2 domain-containing membrane protein YozV
VAPLATALQGRGRAVFQGIILRWRIRVEALVRSGVWGAIAMIALIVALLFGGAAVFVLAQAEFGTIRALLGFAGAFLAIALIAAIGIAVTRRSAARKEQAALASAPSVPSWLLDPRLLAAGLDVGKTLGARRTLAIGLAGAFLFGMWLSRNLDQK